MGYSDKDLENVHGSLDGSQELEPVVWNASTVYFDDELVEYQGKHYIALCKTSAEVPGRCKAGIWKEVIIPDNEEALGVPVYEDIYEEPMASSQNKQESIEARNIAKEKAAEIKQSTIPTPKEVQVSAPAKRPTNKPANKPLTTRKTLKEREEQVQASKKQTGTAQVQTMAPTRKMQAPPSEQHIVNDILKEMEFKKIKGFNTDDNNICKNLILPQSKAGATLEWNSSHQNIISSKGEVTRPLDGNDVAVNLSLTVKLNKTSATRFYTLWVKAEEQVLSDKECVDLVFEALSFDHIKGQNEKASVITTDLELLTHGLYETEIFWASKSRELLDETGHFYKNVLSKNTKIRLYAIIAKGNEERLKCFDLVLKV